VEERGYIEIKIDNVSNTLSPKDVDIKEIRELMSDIENFLYPNQKDKNTRPHISYSLENGSASNKFFLPISGVLLFNGLTSEISKRKSLNFLSYKQQEVIANFQKKAIKSDLILELRSSLNPDSSTLIIDKNTSFQVNTPLCYEGEFYIYGEIYQEGGKQTPNIHMTTKNGENLTIYATKDQILDGEKRMYQICGVKAKGKKNLEDGSYSDLKLVHFISYQPTFNMNLLHEAIEKAKANLSKIKDLDNWIDELKTEVI
jgi:hypothetical protein